MLKVKPRRNTKTERTSENASFLHDAEFGLEEQADWSEEHVLQNVLTPKHGVFHAVYSVSTKRSDERGKTWFSECPQTFSQAHPEHRLS